MKAFLMTRLAALNFLIIVLGMRAESRCHAVPKIVQHQAISASKAGSGRRTSLACSVACWNGQTQRVSSFLAAFQVIISAFILKRAVITQAGWLRETE